MNVLLFLAMQFIVSSSQQQPKAKDNNSTPVTLDCRKGGLTRQGEWRTKAAPAKEGGVKVGRGCHNWVMPQGECRRAHTYAGEDAHGMEAR
jgi:hypothetical protein